MKKKNQLCFLMLNKTAWKHHNKRKRGIKQRVMTEAITAFQKKKIKKGRKPGIRAEAEMEEKLLQLEERRAAVTCRLLERAKSFS